MLRLQDLDTVFNWIASLQNEVIASRDSLYDAYRWFTDRDITQSLTKYMLAESKGVCHTRGMWI